MATKKRSRNKKTAKKKNYRQTGKSNTYRDEQRAALPPGKRKSRSGVTYHERRKNRSDMPGKMTGISAAKLKARLREIEKNNLASLLLRRDLATTKRMKRKLSKQITKKRSDLRKLN